MSLRSEKLDTALQANHGRRNESNLRMKLRAVALHAQLNKAGDVEVLKNYAASGADESIYFSSWFEVAPTFLKALDRFSDEIILAPYNFEECGSARVHKTALKGLLTDNPLEFDNDGFWIADECGALLVDFDDDDLRADVRLVRYRQRKD